VPRPASGMASAPALRALRDKLVDLWRARELLRQFVGKELKLRYKNSALGFLWSLLTPALMTLVFTAVFGFAFRLSLTDFPAFFLSGFLAWQLFQTSAQGSIHAIVGNGALIRKVYFPREVLPLAIVIAQLIHFLLAFAVLSPYLIATRGWGVVTHLPAALLAVALLTVFTAGVSMMFAAANVPFRDLQELIVVIFLLWFYATPVIYPTALTRLGDAAIVQGLARVVELNPMTWFLQLFRDAVFGPIRVNPMEEGERFVALAPAWPSLELVGLCTAAALVTFACGYLVFTRLALTFAKEV
jgi:ABC-type polysaccharide/polyol phosphate export permease